MWALVSLGVRGKLFGTEIGSSFLAVKVNILLLVTGRSDTVCSLLYPDLS